jgi:hypothetical protein
MGKYQAPKRRLHRDFVYLNDESIINSLSAFEAGKVDEIIEKTTEATDRGLGASLGVGPVKADAARKRQGQLQEELVRKRTRFSSFEAWHLTMADEEAIGTFDAWDMGVRDSLRPGDTIEFDAEIELTPLHMMLATFLAFARSAGKEGSPFKQQGQQLAATKRPR